VPSVSYARGYDPTFRSRFKLRSSTFPQTGCHVTSPKLALQFNQTRCHQTERNLASHYENIAEQLLRASWYLWQKEKNESDHIVVDREKPTKSDIAYSSVPRTSPRDLMNLSGSIIPMWLFWGASGCIPLTKVMFRTRFIQQGRLGPSPLTVGQGWTYSMTHSSWQPSWTTVRQSKGHENAFYSD